MKYLGVALIALFSFVAAGEEWKPVTDPKTQAKIQQGCFEHSALTKEQIEQVRKLDLPDLNEMNEYVLCHVTKLGVFDEERGYDAGRVLAQLAAMDLATENARKGVPKCVSHEDDQHSTPAAHAYRGVTCMIEATKADRENK